jgi:chromosome segregation ATPase
MKSFALTILMACALSGTCVSVFAHDREYRNDDNDRSEYTQVRWDRLESELNHLNRMVGHVRWELGRYRADWQSRREFESIRRQVDRVNWKYRNNAYDRRDLRREIERLHADLHNLEVRLRAKSWDYYRWR